MAQVLLGGWLCCLVLATAFLVAMGASCLPQLGRFARCGDWRHFWGCSLFVLVCFGAAACVGNVARFVYPFVFRGSGS